MRERVERGRELDAAAADPRMIGTDDAHVGIDRHHRAGLGGAVTVDVDLAGENQRARLLARFDEALLDEQRIEPLALRLISRPQDLKTYALRSMIQLAMSGEPRIEQSGLLEGRVALS